MIKKAVYRALLVVCFWAMRISTILMLKANQAYIEANREQKLKRRNRRTA